MSRPGLLSPSLLCTRILRAADGVEIGRAQSNMILSRLLPDGERIGYASAPFPHGRIVAPAR